MNKEAEQHLGKAAGYIGNGEDFYRRAADEIIAAQKADPTVGYREIGAKLGRSKDWCRKLVLARTSGDVIDAPFAGEYAKVKENLTTSTLKSAPMEQVERIIEKLPPERKQKIAAAFGHRHSQVREAFEEKERNLTPLQRKEREANHSTIDDFAARLTAPFVGASIVLLIEEATEKLQEINEHNQMTSELEQAITAALIKLNQEFQVASAMVGSWSEEEPA